MKVITNKREQTSLAKKLTFTVEDPITHRYVYQVEIDRKEAEQAIEYLRVHNGQAPQFVHAFIDGMELALTLRVRKDS